MTGVQTCALPIYLRKAFKKDACESEVKVDGTANFLVGQISHRKSFGVFRSAVHYMKFCVCFTADAFSVYKEDVYVTSR